MARRTLDELYLSYVRSGDVQALAELFDRLAPELASLARQLVRSREEAEDLVQETFLTAIESPASFDQERALEPWLVGILVNRARSARRAASRSLEVERLESREVATPEREVSAVEQREVLERAVAELPEKLRVVVEARLAGTSADWTTRELGISHGALRTRFHRALARLRVLLPAGLASTLAFVFLGSRGLARVRATVVERAEPRALSRSAMNRARASSLSPNQVIGAVAMSAALLLAWSLLRLPGGESVGEGRNGFGSEVAATRGQRPPARANRVASNRALVPAQGSPSTVPEPDMPEAEAPPFTPSSLSGIVVDDLGAGVPFAKVQAWNSPYNSGAPAVIVEADERGKFRLNGLGPDFVVTAETPTLACTRGLRGALPSGSDVDGLKLKLAPAGVLRGVVRSPDGRPVEGAEVWVSNGLNSRSVYDLTSVDGVTTFRAGRGEAITSASGAFEIAGLPPGMVYLEVKSKPYLIYREYHDRSGGMVEVVLDPGLTIRGTVLDASGKPAAGARVRMWPYDGNLHTVPGEVSADARGDFELVSVLHDLESMDGAGVAVGVLLDGHAAEIVQPIVPAELGGRDLSIELVRERRIAGRVVDTEGLPVAGVEVWIEGDRELELNTTFPRPSTWEYHLGLGETETDAEGRFLFDKLYDGEFLVHVLLSEEGDLSIEKRVHSGDEQLEFVFDQEAARKVVIVGRVTDALTGAPIPSFNAFAWPDADATESVANGQRARTDPSSGRFELLGLDEDRIAVSFTAQGYNDLRIEKRFYSVGEYTLDVELIPSRSLTVSVVDMNGVVTDPGYVRARRADGEAVKIESGSGLEAREMRLIDGKAFLHGLPAEALVLEVEVAPFDSVQLPIDLTTPFDGELEVRIERGSSVRLKLLVLTAGTDVDPAEFARRWKHRRLDEDDWNWCFRKLYFTEGLLPGVVVDVGVVDTRGRVLAALELTPSEANSPLDFPRREGVVEPMYAVETRTQPYGPNSYGSWSSSIFSELSIEVPRERLRLLVRAKGFRQVDTLLDLTAVEGGEHAEVLMLVPEGR